MKGVEPKRAIDFLRILHNLKVTKRTGWVRKGVNGPESIADHMYRMSVMAMIAGEDESVDKDKCIKMALVHDMAEALAGDIAPSDGISKAEKHRMETEALAEMRSTLAPPSSSDETPAVSREILELWTEYEAGASPEARLLKDMDKVEMILQALEYEDASDPSRSDHPGSLDLEEFFQSVEGKLQTRTGQQWAEEIFRRRRERTERSEDPGDQ